MLSRHLFTEFNKKNNSMTKQNVDGLQGDQINMTIPILLLQKCTEKPTLGIENTIQVQVSPFEMVKNRI